MYISWCEDGNKIQLGHKLVVIQLAERRMGGSFGQGELLGTYMAAGKWRGIKENNK